MNKILTIDEQLMLIFQIYPLDWIKMRTWGPGGLDGVQLVDIISETEEVIFKECKRIGFSSKTIGTLLNYKSLGEGYSIYANKAGAWVLSYSERGCERRVFGVFDDVEQAERAFVALVYKSACLHIDSFLQSRKIESA